MVKSGDYGWNGVFIFFRLPGSLHIPDGWSETARTRDEDFSTVKATNLLEQLKKNERAERPNEGNVRYPNEFRNRNL